MIINNSPKNGVKHSNIQRAEGKGRELCHEVKRWISRGVSLRITSLHYLQSPAVLYFSISLIFDHVPLVANSEKDWKALCHMSCLNKLFYECRDRIG